MKIETGKYYRARDGRKVGPMVKWAGGEGSRHPWQVGMNGDGTASTTFCVDGDIWRNDGTSIYTGYDGQLVEEWSPTWAEMTDEEKGATLLAKYDGDGSEFNPPEPISLDWSVIKPEYKWAAVDKDGKAFVYQYKPRASKGYNYWEQDDEVHKINHLSSFNRGTVDWQNSLIERPSDV